MEVPNEVQSIVESARRGMNRHPDYHLDWRVRRSLYYTMRKHHEQHGAQAQRWLAIKAAEKVLPIFQSRFGDDHLPTRLLDVARSLVSRSCQLSEAELDQLEEEGYLGTGIDCMSWRGQIAYDAEYAGAACYRAFLEVRSRQSLLNRTENLIRGQETLTWPRQGHLRPEDITDKEIAHLVAYSDTAGCAAVSFATEAQEYRLDRSRLKQFWEWWTTEAMHDAWARLES